MNDREATAPDGSEIARLRTELDEANARVAHMYELASLGRLLAGVVHEINTPIGSIFSNNEVILRSLEKLRGLLSQTPAPPAALEILETIQSLTLVDKIACERISSVIRSLRTYSRADESDLRSVDLHEILRNTLKLSACEYRGRIKVETDFGELPQVECYPHLLSQVFLNLLINAGQAIEREGKVTVTTRLEGDRVRIDIADNGKGIRPEDRPKIFAVGFTTKPPGLGTGLGLSISRQIVVEIHGGEMDFTSELGAGSSFSIRIPLRQREAACC
jgi:signal transduction histidine kinase